MASRATLYSEAVIPSPIPILPRLLEAPARANGSSDGNEKIREAFLRGGRCLHLGPVVRGTLPCGRTWVCGGVQLLQLIDYGPASDLGAGASELLHRSRRSESALAEWRGQCIS